MLCVAIRNRGSACTRLAVCEDRCKLHYNSMIAKGPKETILSEMTMRQETERLKLNARERAGDDIAEESSLMKIRQQYEVARVYKIIELMPDALEDIKTRERIEVREMHRRAKHNERIRQQNLRRNEYWREEIQDRGDIARQIEEERENLNLFNERLAELEAAGGLFHNDPQNIHRQETVNEVVKKTIQKVITIPVPAETCWNMETISKTPGEIIVECKLSIPAGKLLVEKYTSNETIYDMVEGIYGKTLDSVWQYIKNSSDKEVLVKTLKTELEDNIGMCAQGNLSRLCNVLQGYLDDMPTPSSAEILGDLLPPLMTIMDLAVRREKAIQILRTHNVPEDTHSDWLAPLMDG